MRSEFNIYCDESCHLEHDRQRSMVLGAVWCEKVVTREIFERIREIKIRHGLKPNFELKWTKVSPSRLQFYEDIIDYYFDDDDLSFRALVVPDKFVLNHPNFNQTHDEFYYKMYFDMLKVILNPNHIYNIYLDIKDTRSQEKVNKLADILRSSHYDYDNRIIRKIQLVRSHEVELIQVTDLLIGALSYVYRNLSGSEAKLRLINKIRHRSHYSLLKTTLYSEHKMNIFRWKARRVLND